MTERANALTPADLGIGVLFDVIRDAIVVADATTGRVVLWNQAAADVFGYSPREAVGMPLAELVPADLRHQHEHGLARFATTGGGDLVASGAVVEVPAVRADGTTVWVELRLSALDRTPTPGRFALAVIRETTGRRNELAQMATANEALRNFLSIASHDLNTPLTAIGGAAEMLLRDRDQRADREVLVGIIERQTKWLARLVDDFATVARVESGALTPVGQPVSVVEAVREIVDGRPDEPVRVEGAADVYAHVDPVDLRRIVENLVENAYKYGAPPVSVTVAHAHHGVTITVADSGAGVPEAERNSLFDKFWRGRNSSGSRGSGLGLAIVRDLAQANGGRAWYEHGDRPSFVVWLRPERVERVESD